MTVLWLSGAVFSLPLARQLLDALRNTIEQTSPRRHIWCERRHQTATPWLSTGRVEWRGPTGGRPPAGSRWADNERGGL